MLLNTKSIIDCEEGFETDGHVIENDRVFKVIADKYTGAVLALNESEEYLFFNSFNDFTNANLGDCKNGVDIYEVDGRFFGIVMYGGIYRDHNDELRVKETRISCRFLKPNLGDFADALRHISEFLDDKKANAILSAIDGMDDLFVSDRDVVNFAIEAIHGKGDVYV